jgi:hypothetical protein
MGVIGTATQTIGKHMTDFWHAIEWLIYGFVVGWFANPIYRLLTRIVEEAKIAKDQWRNPK